MIAGQPPLREQAPAKLNLNLKVVGRRQDGYHLIDSVVVFTELADLLELMPGAKLGLTAEGPFASAMPRTDENLVLRAALLLARAYDRQPDVSFRLVKRLPVAAGIGGGSADAAAALRLLARWWSIVDDDPKLESVALQLGADVPVCLRSRRSHMSGIGEIVRPLPGEPPKAAVLANPGVELATAKVFARLKAPTNGDVALVDGKGANDLLAPATELAPVVADVISALEVTKGCRTAAMSGSGPTCYALFDDQTEASAAANIIQRNHPTWWVAATRLLD